MTSDCTGGLFFDDPAGWIPQHILSAVCAVGVVLLCAIGLVLLVRRINFVHSTSVIYSVVMVLGCLLVPSTVLQFGAPQLVLAATIIGLALLLPDFGKPSATHIFLTFSTLAFGATCQSAFLGLIIIFLAGCVTLQFTQPRMLAGALFGMTAPIWILCGFGLADITQIAWPQFVTIFSPDAVTPGNYLTLLTVGVIALITVFLTLGNSVKVFAANAAFRAANRFIIIITAGAILLILLDINNIVAYVPLLCMTLGIQAAHFYTYRICRKY